MENMKTIAVIESCDTKFKEAKFISDFFKNEGLKLKNKKIIFQNKGNKYKLYLTK